MTKSEAKTALTAALAAATATIDTAVAGGYASTQEYESAANAVRTSIATLIPELDQLWGVLAVPTIAALRALAARLVDLHSAIADTTATVELTVARSTSLVELAVELYGDGTRWVELAPLNPGLRHPGFIAAGTVVVARAR